MPIRTYSTTFLLSLGLLSVPSLEAQAGHCAIAGRVTDSSGAVLQGAQVQLA
jgi:hypothetical protein